MVAPHAMAANTRHSPGTPFKMCVSRSSNAIPDPATRSYVLVATSLVALHGRIIVQEAEDHEQGRASAWDSPLAVVAPWVEANPPR